MCDFVYLYLDDFSEVEIDVCGEESQADLTLLIFSYVNRRVGHESAHVCVIEYVTGSRENWLKSCYLAHAHSVCTEV